MNKPVMTRRQLIKASAVGLGSATLAWLARLHGFSPSRAQAPENPPNVLYLPVISRQIPPPPAVIHIHSNSATTWNSQADYWNYVNQGMVNAMVEYGIKSLTGMSALADAWRKLLPNCQAGQGIAIKVNFNNEGNGKIDALSQTVIAIVRGLKLMGVRETDVWVYDAWKRVPDRFINGCLAVYPGLRIYDNGSHTAAGFGSSDPNAYVGFSPPPGVPMPATTKVTDVLVRASYVINLPILKGHMGEAGVTLGFKNHLGSSNNPIAFHDYIWPKASYCRSDYNGLVDLYRNPNIRGKTILTIGDGLFAGNRWDSYALKMSTFGNRTPNSLFFATDPVAIDSVMYDFLAAEWAIDAGADNYLRLASAAGLGVFERGNPWGGGYTKIAYQRVEL